MKAMKLLVPMVVGSTSAAYAASAQNGEGSGILTYFFIGFFALIVVSQLVPAMILFAGMLKGLFTRQGKTSVHND